MRLESANRLCVGHETARICDVLRRDSMSVCQGASPREWGASFVGVFEAPTLVCGALRERDVLVLNQSVYASDANFVIMSELCMPSPRGPFNRRDPSFSGRDPGWRKRFCLAASSENCVKLFIASGCQIT